MALIFTKYGARERGVLRSSKRVRQPGAIDAVDAISARFSARREWGIDPAPVVGDGELRASGCFSGLVELLWTARAALRCIFTKLLLQIISIKSVEGALYYDRRRTLACAVMVEVSIFCIVQKERKHGKVESISWTIFATVVEGEGISTVRLRLSSRRETSMHWMHWMHWMLDALDAALPHALAHWVPKNPEEGTVVNTGG